MKQDIDERLRGLEPMETPRLLTRSLAEVEAADVRWLWKNRIVQGDFGLLAGLPGIGKSYACAAIAANLTRGHALPGEEEPHKPIDVLLLSLEDSPEHVLRPRFERLGADLGRVHIIDGVSTGESVAAFTLRHLAILEDWLKQGPSIGLLIIDPVASEMAGIDTWRSNDVRAVLDPFLARARAYDVAVLGVTHTTKRNDGAALLKVEGSLGGFVGRARYVLGVGEDDAKQRGIGVLKSNYGMTEGVPVVQYAIDEDQGFRWGAETTAIQASDLFGTTPTEAERSATEEARDAIIEALSAGELSAEDFAKRVRAVGIHPATLNRVRPKMRKEGVIERLGGGVSGPVRWRLATPIDSQETPLIRTCASANECVPMRKNEPPEDGELTFFDDGAIAV